MRFCPEILNQPYPATVLGQARRTFERASAIAATMIPMVSIATLKTALYLGYPLTFELS